MDIYGNITNPLISKKEKDGKINTFWETIYK